MRILLLILLLSLSCKKESIEKVKYEVTCNPSGVDITYQNETGNTEQKDVKLTKWILEFPAENGQWVYILAQAKNENAVITAKIYWKGKVIEQSNSSGDYVIATVSCFIGL